MRKAERYWTQHLEWQTQFWAKTHRNESLLLKKWIDVSVVKKSPCWAAGTYRIYSLLHRCWCGKKITCLETLKKQSWPLWYRDLRSMVLCLQAQNLTSSLPAQQLFTKLFKMKVSVLLSKSAWYKVELNQSLVKQNRAQCWLGSLLRLYRTETQSRSWLKKLWKNKTFLLFHHSGSWTCWKINSHQHLQQHDLECAIGKPTKSLKEVPLEIFYRHSSPQQESLCWKETSLTNK